MSGHVVLEMLWIIGAVMVVSALGFVALRFLGMQPLMLLGVALLLAVLAGLVVLFRNFGLEPRAAILAMLALWLGPALSARARNMWQNWRTIRRARENNEAAPPGGSVGPPP